MNKKYCNTCKFAIFKYSNHEGRQGDLFLISHYTCHYFPPMTNGKYPLVHVIEDEKFTDNDWCGKYEDKNEVI